MRVQNGFTLIELMIVVAILGILLAIAIPVYGDYTARANVTEGLSLAASAKLGVSEYVNAHGSFPANNTQAGLADANSITGNAVSAVTVTPGLVTVTYSDPPAIAGNTLVLSAYTTEGALVWTCGSAGSLDDRYRPASCRN